MTTQVLDERILATISGTVALIIYAVSKWWEKRKKEG